MVALRCCVKHAQCRHVARFERFRCYRFQLFRRQRCSKVAVLVVVVQG